MKNNGIGLLVFYVVLVLTLLIGEIKCIYKAINCNWEPIGKAEIIYTACSFVPPVGAIVGWIDIKDK